MKRIKKEIKKLQNVNLKKIKIHEASIFERLESLKFNHYWMFFDNELTNIATTVITKDQYQPADKNIKRLYDLICPNPLVLEQQLLEILANDNRFTQISNKEFRTIIDSKHIFWYFKSKCKKLRTNLEWKTGLVINEQT